ncbi:MAG TPA: pyridoxamine 5'-phosphate oxidase family protein [Gemmatimonadales bacterium]|nr:pyridoxamine 5'-phosphate oxidase family protein [Gemmatimonadales bacterium]
MTRAELLAFMRSHHHAVETAVSPAGSPQAAVVGIVVSDDFELFFDTLGDTRKAQNLRRDRRTAFVIGGPGEGELRTVQYEGVADEPTGDSLAALTALYLARFPDGIVRQSWPGLTYFRVRPTWIRFSDFSVDPPIVLEWDAAALGAVGS